MFKKWRKKRERAKLIVIEILETLVTICMYLGTIDRSGKYRGNLYTHVDSLKLFSELLKEEVVEEHDGTK